MKSFDKKIQFFSGIMEGLMRQFLQACRRGICAVFGVCILSGILSFSQSEKAYANPPIHPIKGAVVDIEIHGERDFTLTVRAINVEDHDICLKTEKLSDAIRVGNQDFHLFFANHDFNGEMHWLETVRILAKSAQNLQFHAQYDEENLRKSAVSFSEFSPPASAKLSQAPQGEIAQLMFGVSLYFEECSKQNSHDSPLWVMSARELVSAQLFPVLKMPPSP